jgi:hypothetical protein
MPYMYVCISNPGLKFYIERPESHLKALKMTINAQKDYQYKALMSYIFIEFLYFQYRLLRFKKPPIYKNLLNLLLFK